MSYGSLADFEIIAILGKGAFSSVFLARRKIDKKQYALKSVQLEKLSPKEQKNSINEARILASIDHPNIIGYIDCFLNEKTKVLYIVMEYANGGDLSQKIKKYKKEKKIFDENEIWYYLIQIINGLKALHDRKIIHRDLKSSNIYLIKVKDKTICKIGDMNMSKLTKDKLCNTKIGTPYYCSPEIWQNKPYSYKSDLWSIGCIIYELCTLNPPFKGKNFDDLSYNICNRKIERINKIYSDDLWKIILMLLEVDVKNRVDCDEFLSNKLVIKKMDELGLENNCLNVNDNNIFHINDLSFIDLTNMVEIKKKLPQRGKYNIDNDSFDEDESTIKNDDSVFGSSINSYSKIVKITDQEKKTDNNFSKIKKGISKSPEIFPRKKLELDSSLKKYRKTKSALKSKFEEKNPLLIIHKEKINIKSNVIKINNKKFLFNKGLFDYVNLGKSHNQFLKSNNQFKKVLVHNSISIKKNKNMYVSTNKTLSLNKFKIKTKKNKTFNTSSSIDNNNNNNSKINKGKKTLKPIFLVKVVSTKLLDKNKSSK